MSILVTCLCWQAGPVAVKKPKLGRKMELLEVPIRLRNGILNKISLLVVQGK